MRWHEGLKAKFKSDASAASELREQWMRVDRQAAKGVEVDSLANRIRALRREGDATGWWKKRPQLRALFAELLELEEGDVFGQPPPTDALEFPEFPALPPLERSETPCRLVAGGGLFENAVAAATSQSREPPLWLHAPPGSGKSLVVRWLQAHADLGVHAVTVDCLADVVAQNVSASVPLVVEVETSRERGDDEAVRMLSMRSAPVVVLAPFPGTWSGSGGSLLRGFRWLERDKSPKGTWRESLLRWIDERLETRSRDTKLIVDEVRSWLARHDPNGELVGTPGDLLALCADFDACGSFEDSPFERARRWITQVGIRQMPVDCPSTWRDACAASTFESLVTGALEDFNFALGTRTAADWRSLVPREKRPAKQDSQVGEALVVAYFRSAGMLRGGTGGLVPYPRWVAGTIESQTIEKRLARPRSGSWSALAADASRRPVVDLALDSVPSATLLRVVREVRERGEVSTLDEVAELESVLAAVARRLSDEGLELREKDREALQWMMQAQVSLLVRHDPSGDADYRYPVTRRDDAEGYLTAWALTLTVPRPVNFERTDLPWWWVGWTEKLEWKDLPKWNFPSSSHPPEDPSPVFRRAIRWTHEFVDRLPEGPVPHGVPRLLLPALLLADRVRPLSWIDLMPLAESWEGIYLAHRVQRLEAPAREEFARRVWLVFGDSGDGVDRASVAQRLSWLQLKWPRLAPLVVENLSLELLERTARTCGINRWRTQLGHQEVSDVNALQMLSREKVRAALRSWMTREAGPPSFGEILELVPLLDEHDVELVVEMTRSLDRNRAAELTDFLWKIAPDDARRETERAWNEKASSVEGWFFSAPREELPRLVALADKEPSPPEWVSDWAMRRLPEAGTAREACFRLARNSAVWR